MGHNGYAVENVINMPPYEDKICISFTEIWETIKDSVIKPSG